MRFNPKSLLFVPAMEKMLSKVGTLGADAYIIDLEDSIPVENKDSSLQLVVNLLENSLEATNIIVRINIDRAEHELSILGKYKHLGFMLPKFETAQTYTAVEDCLIEHFVIALLESPKAIIRLDSICQIKWVDALGFGAEDYTVKVNMENSIETLQFEKKQIVTYAKAYDKQAYDTPSLRIDDIDVFNREVDNAAAIGFNGKFAISPKHVEYINTVFKSHDVDYLKSVVNRYEAQGNAVAVIDGKVYEKMHIARFKNIINESTVNG